MKTQGAADVVYRITAYHERLIKLIAAHEGGKGIRNGELAKKTGLHERTIRRMVRELVLMYHQPIGSSTGLGYYWITRPEEIEENYQRLRRRGIKILQRAAAMKGVALSKLLQQLELDFDLEEI